MSLTELFILLQLFGKFSGQNKGKKKVFFCGPKVMSDTLKEVCEKYSFAFAKENFWWNTCITITHSGAPTKGKYVEQTDIITTK